MSDPGATGRILKRAQYRNHRAIESSLAVVGTTLAQWDALRAISESPASSAHELAIATFQSDQAFGTLANRLEKQGLIERASGRGRRVEHRLTAAGEGMLAAGTTVATRVARRSFAGLSPDEMSTLHELLLRVGDVVE
ncbi:MAG TPA: MarR family transcriptional regulator [Galbitalea sp.]